MNIKMILASLVVGLAGVAHAGPSQPAHNSKPAWGQVHAGSSWGHFVSSVKRAVKGGRGHGHVCR